MISMLVVAGLMVCGVVGLWAALWLVEVLYQKIRQCLT